MDNPHPCCYAFAIGEVTPEHVPHNMSGIAHQGSSTRLDTSLSRSLRQQGCHQSRPGYTPMHHAGKPAHSNNL